MVGEAGEMAIDVRVAGGPPWIVPPPPPEHDARNATSSKMIPAKLFGRVMISSSLMG
jgi:hypothetical protein